MRSRATAENGFPRRSDKRNKLFSSEGLSLIITSLLRRSMVFKYGRPLVFAFFIVNRKPTFFLYTFRLQLLYTNYQWMTNEKRKPERTSMIETSHGRFWTFARINPELSAAERTWHIAMLLSFIAEQRAA